MIWLQKEPKNPTECLPRAEYRLILREDNTSQRLFKASQRLGFLKESDLLGLDRELQDRSLARQSLKEGFIYPNDETQQKLKLLGTPVLKKSISYEELLRRPDISCFQLGDFGWTNSLSEEGLEALEIEVKYEGYIRRQQELIGQVKRFESLGLDQDFDYSSVAGLSSEEVEKLKMVKPRNVVQAQRISGVNPSAIQAIMVHLKKDEWKRSVQKGFRTSVQDGLSPSRG